MPRYLIVTHQTAYSPELRHKVSQLVNEEASARFGILVPELHDLDFTWEGETVNVAKQRAESLSCLLEETLHATVVSTAVGSSDPLRAIEEELNRDSGYDTLIICTFPPGLSRWLHMDLVHRAKKFGLPVVHVVASSPPT